MGSEESKGPTPEEVRQMKQQKEEQEKMVSAIKAEKVTKNLDDNIDVF